MRSPYASLAVAVVFVVQVLALGVYYPKWRLSGPEALISWDVAGYYMYLPAGLVYGDLAGGSYDSVVTAYGAAPAQDYNFAHASGARVMKYPLGQALQFAPFFAVAHAFAKTSAAYPADGFSRPYQLAIAVEVLCVALLGLLLLRWLLLRYFPDPAVALTIAGIGLGTNYLEYTTLSGAMTHNNLFAIYLLLVAASGAFYRRPTLALAAGIGALVGLAGLTRPTEVMTALIPLLWGVWPTRRGLLGRFDFLRAHLPALGVAALTGGALLALQAVYWHAVSGAWVVYSYEDQGFSWLRPHLLQGMFSLRGGWIPYSPLAVLMLAGLLPLWRRQRALFVGVAVYWALLAYVTWAWDLWLYGGSLGQRGMVQCYALLAFPLAALVDAVLASRSAVAKAGLGAVLAACVYYNVWLTHQAHRGEMFRAGAMTGRYLWAVLGTWTEDRADRVLLDRAYRYTGPVENVDTLVRIGFEDLSAALACPEWPLTGDRSFCLHIGNVGVQPAYPVPLPPPGATWMRLGATLQSRNKEWTDWMMGEVLLCYLRGGKVVEECYARPERLYDAGVYRMTFDCPVDAGPFDALEVRFRKWAGEQSLAVDEVWVTAYRRG